MKRILLAAMVAAMFQGCASEPATHETTTMDRELALKLADRQPVIVAPAAPAPVVNVNNYNGGTHGPWEKYQPTAQAGEPTQCVNSPNYDINGALSGYTKRCFGGGE